jgi:hypothetical protein
MSDQQGADDDFSGLGGFFFYVFIVHPCTAWILRPGRFERKKSIMYAIAFLAALAAIKTGELFILIYLLDIERTRDVSFEPSSRDLRRGATGCSNSLCFYKR